MIPNVHLLCRRDKVIRQVLWVSFCYEWEILQHQKIFTAIHDRLLFLHLEWPNTNHIIGVESAYFILAEQLLNVVFLMERIKLEESLELASCCKHDFLGSTRVHFYKLCDVVNRVFIRNPYLLIKTLVFAYVCSSIHW